MTDWTFPESRQPHPKTVTEAASFFDKHFKGWYKKIDLSKFEVSICTQNCVFGQVFADYRFDLYRKIFREEDEGLPPNKNPKQAGMFWLKKYEPDWIAEIQKRKDRSNANV